MIVIVIIIIVVDDIKFNLPAINRHLGVADCLCRAHCCGRCCTVTKYSGALDRTCLGLASVDTDRWILCLRRSSFHICSGSQSWMHFTRVSSVSLSHIL